MNPTASALLRPRRPALRTLLLVAAAMASGAAFAPRAENLSAHSPASDPFRNLAVVDERELAAARGGLELGGLSLEFGADVRTYVDGSLALQTLVNMVDDRLVSHTISHIAPETAVTNTATDTGASANAATTASTEANNTGAASAPTAPGKVAATVNLAGLPNGSRVVLSNSSGITAVVHQVTRERILSALVNTANNRVLQQKLNVNVTIHNFRQYQQAVRDALLNSQLGRSVTR
jgi:hypothetical protein